MLLKLGTSLERIIVLSILTCTVGIAGLAPHVSQVWLVPLIIGLAVAFRWRKIGTERPLFSRAADFLGLTIFVSVMIVGALEFGATIHWCSGPAIECGCAKGTVSAPDLPKSDPCDQCPRCVPEGELEALTREEENRQKWEAVSLMLVRAVVISPVLTLLLAAGYFFSGIAERRRASRVERAVAANSDS